MRLLRQLIATIFVLLPLTTAFAGEGEYKVKAAMLYNFAKFVEWPADSFGIDSRITFCLVGKSPLNDSMQPMQGKLAKGRAVLIRQIAALDDVSACQVLFIPQSEHVRLSAYLQQANMRSILTVSDIERFAASGGMIGFYEEDNTVRFEINLEAAQKQRLQISSYLLKLARSTR